MQRIAISTAVLIAGQQAMAGDPNAFCASAPTRVRPDSRPRVTVTPPASPIAPPGYQGWGSASFQVRVTGLTPGDQVLSFTSEEDGVGPDGTGRRNPFAVPSMLASSASGQLNVFVEDDGTSRRIAGANATTMLTNLDYGIRIGQAPQDVAGPEFESALHPILFQFDLQVGSVPGPRDIYISVPYESILGGGMSYYTSPSGELGFVSIVPEDQVTFVMHVVECPSDFNADDGVDFFDYLDFVDAFSMGDDVADFNNDSSVDFGDYLDFVMQFSTGC